MNNQMTAKEKYQMAYRVIRSSKHEKPGTPRSYWGAFQYAKRWFGDNIATAAYNSEINKNK